MAVRVNLSRTTGAGVVCRRYLVRRIYIKAQGYSAISQFLERTSRDHAHLVFECHEQAARQVELESGTEQTPGRAIRRKPAEDVCNLLVDTLGRRISCTDHPYAASAPCILPAVASEVCVSLRVAVRRLTTKQERDLSGDELIAAHAESNGGFVQPGHRLVGSAAVSPYTTAGRSRPLRSSWTSPLRLSSERVPSSRAAMRSHASRSRRSRSAGS